MTKAMSAYWFTNWILTPILRLFAFAPHEGAYTTLFAATSPAVKADKGRYAGAYLWPFGVVTEPTEEAKNPTNARDLWETSERVVSTL